LPATSTRGRSPLNERSLSMGYFRGRRENGPSARSAAGTLNWLGNREYKARFRLNAATGTRAPRFRRTRLAWRIGYCDWSPLDRDLDVLAGGVIGLDRYGSRSAVVAGSVIGGRDPMYWRERSRGAPKRPSGWIGPSVRDTRASSRSVCVATRTKKEYRS
jgi:hypothetical protein